MKTIRLFSAIFLFLLLYPFLQIRSQESGSVTSAIYPTLGVAIGFFYPADVNDYIEQQIMSGYSSTVNTELYMYYEIKGGLTYRLKKVDFSAFIEYDIAPKLVVVTNGENTSYAYSRFAPELSANYFIPNKSGKNAFFIGGGINYSFMKFKEFNGSNPGFKLQAGYSMQFSKINIQPYGAFRYVKATDSSDALWGVSDESDSFDLSYTGGQIGVILSFHERLLYK